MKSEESNSKATTGPYRILAVFRDARFSPNSIENDRLILQAVAERLGRHYGVEVSQISEALFVDHPQDADIIITMGRLQRALSILTGMEQKGCLVINSAEGINRCQRSYLDKLMRENGISVPAQKGDHGYWLKRGDAAAQSKRDVVYCKDEETLRLARLEFEERGIENVVVSAHVVGDVVKFYGVRDNMFRCFYPSDDGISKFGDEKINGEAHHYHFNKKALHDECERLSNIIDVPIYGGDAIIDKDGNFFIIDFNDWPSFWRCREEAADAIAEYVVTSFNNK